MNHKIKIIALALLAATASRADTIYVSNQGNNTIEQFTSGGVGSVFANTGLSNPQGLAFDSAGNLYAANQSNNTIEKFTSGGVGSLFASLAAPSGLAFDSVGNLYAASYGNSTIEKYTSGGVGSLFANTGLNFPDFLAIEPTASPEPSTLALLGLGAAGLLGLRRRA